MGLFNFWEYIFGFVFFYLYFVYVFVKFEFCTLLGVGGVEMYKIESFFYRVSSEVREMVRKLLLYRMVFILMKICEEEKY